MLRKATLSAIAAIAAIAADATATTAIKTDIFHLLNEYYWIFFI